MEKVIIVSGFAGSGKSSLADSLGKELGLEVVHASAILKEMKEKGTDISHKNIEKSKDWWESDEAKEFMKKRKEDSSLDIALDKKLEKIADKGQVILDSWTMPYLYKKPAFKVWLHASAEVRAKRVSGRDDLDYNSVLERIKARDAETKALYRRLYNFSMGENLEVFSIIVDTDKVSQSEVLEIVLAKLKE